MDIFDELLKFNPNCTAISINNKVCSYDFEAEIEIRDTSLDTCITELFSILVKANIQDFGIGSYEYWGSRGYDVHYAYEIENLEFELKWPIELKWLEEKILDKIEELIGELDVDHS